MTKLGVYCSVDNTNISVDCLTRWCCCQLTVFSNFYALSTALLTAFFPLFSQAGNSRMASLLDEAGKLGWILFKALLRFVFMFLNNIFAIPSYCLYLILLQPLRIMDSRTFWHIEGVMFKWLLAMVSCWGWSAGYTGECSAVVAASSLFAYLALKLLCYRPQIKSQF